MVFISYRSLVTSFGRYLTRFIGIRIHLRWYIYDVYGTKAQIVSKMFFLHFITTRFLELKVGQPAFHLHVYLLTWGMGSAFCVVMVQDISSSREYSWMTRENEPLKICTSLLCRQDYASLSIFAVLLNKYILELFSLKYNLDVLFLCKRKIICFR